MTEYGLLLPHFGEHADPKKIIEGARTAESLGFDSVWVRDHLLFEPHGEFEKPNAAFYEALTTLTAVGASTERLRLGTGALIPTRHPLHTAQIAATMTQFFGPRLIIGLGSGNFDHEFDAVGLGGVPRPELVERNVHIMRKMWTESTVDWSDDVFDFAGATIEPRPTGDVPIWYCGNTPRSARLAADFCDGWMPGRIAIDTLRARVALLAERSERNGRPMPTVAMIPPTSIAADRETALSRVNVEGLLKWANNARFWVTPSSGGFTGADDLEGVLVYGSPPDVVEQAARLGDTGADHIVFDLRFTFDRWEEQLDLLGTEVLPELRAANGRQ